MLWFKLSALGTGLFLLLLLSACEQDPCEDITCLNGGTCNEGICECPPGFLGDDCGTVDVSRLAGNYEAEYEGCFQVAPDHEVQLDQSSQNGFELEFINLGDYACPAQTDGRTRVQARLDGSAIQVPMQTICAAGNFAGYQFSGSGTAFSDSIRLAFSVTYEANGSSRTDNCTAILTKP